MAEWISVKDRMPEENEFVLAYEKCGCITISSFNSGFDWWTDGGESTEPTHWMPLPKPPEGE